MKRDNQKGAALIEFALVLPVLMLILLGTIEFGIIFYDKAVITNASREGARAAIIYGYDPVAKEIKRLSGTQIGEIVNNYVSTNLITFGAGTAVTTTVPANPTKVSAGTPITVNVTYRYDYLALPAFATSLLGNVNIVGTTTMRAE